ncbi:hypothetical protein FSP39_023631 [Pinctada imbricata]|uniref:Amine oxidase n=1 Tax=Pinctada imbricata TaxID=66713 RepID=A0AA89BL83_PINIB|nr:hypothetical protein FSP39_023631 [Pinctada imbricata]
MEKEAEGNGLGKVNKIDEKHVADNCRKNKKLMFVVIFVTLVTVCAILLIALVCVVVLKNKELAESKVPTCGGHTGVIDISEQSEPSVFSDLTAAEVKGLTEYLYNNKELNLVRPSEVGVDKNYVYLAEIYLPDKDETVTFLDGNINFKDKPKREAKVIIFKGNQSSPEVQEIVVSPLPNPNKHRTLRDGIPLSYCITLHDAIGAEKYLTKMVKEKIQDILRESYEGSISSKCGDHCLTFGILVPVSRSFSGVEKLRFLFGLYQHAGYYLLHPVDFSVLMEVDRSNYTIVKVWYNGQVTESLEALKQGYDKGTIEKQHVPFPKDDDTLYSKMTRRGPAFPESGQRPPFQIEPDGKRYRIKGRQVTYMNWRFDFRMSTLHGPQLYDIRYQNKRIVYELSVQEIAVFYSGHSPIAKYANFFDSIGLIGSSAKGLVPGVDCPAHATFLPSSHFLQKSEKLVTFQNVFCVFEQDTGMPLRRHHSYSKYHGMFYEGMPGHVLILRTIVTIVNYDYIVDFIFYQNGAMETKVVSTGYIITTQFSEKETSYGARVDTYITGNLHHHLFHFKVDLDINGIKNRYDTMDIDTTIVQNNFHSDKNAKITMAKFERSAKLTEKDAAYKFNFDTPKYHIFYNNLTMNSFGNPKAYRVLLKGMSKQILPKDKGNEPSASWFRYQMAVTKHKETERSSSSLYSTLESVVNFQTFIDDNESLMDEDLVAWISLGIQHIPHTEDLPVTHTPGMDLSFFLLPYNYFPEDPSMASRDSVRIEPKMKNNANVGINFIRHSKPRYKRCLPKKNMYQELLQKNPGILFDLK